LFGCAILVSVAHSPRRVQGDITESLYRDVDIYASPRYVVLNTMLPDAGILGIVPIVSGVMHDPVCEFPGIPLLGFSVNRIVPPPNALGSKLLVLCSTTHAALAYRQRSYVHERVVTLFNRRD
jgi:hypothetical protein